MVLARHKVIGGHSGLETCLEREREGEEFEKGGRRDWAADLAVTPRARGKKHTIGETGVGKCTPLIAGS